MTYPNKLDLDLGSPHIIISRVSSYEWKNGYQVTITVLKQSNDGRKNCVRDIDEAYTLSLERGPT